MPAFGEGTALCVGQCMKQGLIDEDTVRIFGELLCAKNTEGNRPLVNSMIPRDVSYGCILSKEGSSAWAQQSMSKFRRAEIETIAHGVTETEAIGICHSEEKLPPWTCKV